MNFPTFIVSNTVPTYYTKEMAEQFSVDKVVLKTKNNIILSFIFLPKQRAGGHDKLYSDVCSFFFLSHEVPYQLAVSSMAFIRSFFLERSSFYPGNSKF